MGNGFLKERSKPFDTGHIGLFAKKARCAECGYAMRSSKSKGRHYLQCASRHAAKGACEGAFISVGRLEETVLQELSRLLSEYLNKEALMKGVELCADLSEQRARLCSEIEAMQRKIEECSRGIRELYIDKIKGIISERDFYELSADFSEERENLKEPPKKHSNRRRRLRKEHKRTAEGR